MCSFYKTLGSADKTPRHVQRRQSSLDSREQYFGRGESGGKGEMSKALGEIHALAPWRVWSGQFFAACDAILTARQGLLAQTLPIHAGGPSSYHPD
jgi:hypothetical protein